MVVLAVVPMLIVVVVAVVVGLRRNAADGLSGDACSGRACGGLRGRRRGGEEPIVSDEQ